jgi:hypothetical protein
MHKKSFLVALNGPGHTNNNIKFERTMLDIHDELISTGLKERTFFSQIFLRRVETSIKSFKKHLRII